MLIDVTGLEYHERLLFLLLCAGIVAAGTWYGFRQLRRYRLIADTPTARVRSAHQGYVELVGQALPGPEGPVRSPLTGNECLWYHYRVEREKGSGKNRRWVTEKEGTSSQWFQLDDGSGICQIDPEGARIRAESRRRWYGSTPMPGARPARSGSLLNISLSFGRRYRYLEELILEYETLYALGRFQSVGGGRDQLDRDSTAGELIRRWKTRYDDLLARFDSDGNGQLDTDEWQRVQTEAQRQARQQQRQLHALPTMHILNCPDESDQPYLLSTHDEEKLSRHYRWYAHGCFLAVLAASWMAGELLLTL
ncbi:GIDE domain-containing protein [Marinobacterium aestuariivivens]|uniref:RING-type E3 ubiquitin transferase n=1 Tax=Marinobacterium aestuariivivens TaxID=1698799 RepID=A0ABW2A2Y9_9GAMM